MKTMKRYLNSARRRSVLVLMAALALLFAVADAPDSWSKSGRTSGTKPRTDKPKVPGPPGGYTSLVDPVGVVSISTFDPQCDPRRGVVSRWAKWIFKIGSTNLELNLDIPYRDDKGFVGEVTGVIWNANWKQWVADGKGYTRVDSITFDPKTGRIDFRRLLDDKTEWYSGCVYRKEDATPRIPGGAVIDGKFSRVNGKEASRPGASEYKAKFDAAAQYHPVTPPIDIFPLETPGALVKPTPKKTIYFKVCSSSSETATSGAGSVTGKEIPPGNFFYEKEFIGGRKQPVPSDMTPDNPICQGDCTSTYSFDLKADSDFQENWGGGVHHGADTPGCDQVLFQVFDCFVPRANPPGKGKETRYARIDLRAPLPYTVKLSCGSDYVVPEGVDPAPSSPAAVFMPAQRVFRKKANDITNSRNTAKNRLEKRILKMDNAEANYPTTLASLRAVYNQHKNGSLFEIGDIIPVKDVLARIHKLVELGRLPAAEKNEMKSIETFDCPATKAAAEKCVFPVHQYQALLPEIARFFRMMMGRSIYSACARDWACDRDNKNAWGDGKLA